MAWHKSLKQSIVYIPVDNILLYFIAFVSAIARVEREIMRSVGSKTVRRNNYKWWVVFMLWWITFFNYADRQAVFSVFPLLQKDMHLTLVELGMVGSSFAIVYGLAAPFAGHIVDRIRRKTAILGGLYVWSAIAMATALVTSFGQLLGFRAAEGLGETFYFPASASMIGDYHGTRTRSRALGSMITSVYVGTIAGGFFAGLIGERYGWRWAFIIFGGLGMILGLILSRLLDEPERGAADRKDVHLESQQPALRKTSFLEFIKLLARTPTALFLMGAFLCANFVAMVLLSWMPNFLYSKFHLSLAWAGLAATVFVQLASTVGAPLGGWLADILRSHTPRGRLIIQAVGVLGGAPFAWLCGFTRSFAWLVVGLIAWGFFKGIYDANIFAALFDVIHPEARGTACGFMNMVGWLGGGGTGPVVVGFLAERYGLGTAISFTSMVYVLAGVLLILCAVFFAKADVRRMEAMVRERDLLVPSPSEAAVGLH